ncbi:MAG: metallophosphoesterase [Xanthomonadales bacterium]|nr:metallophosphoesterase [Xanthomonadales bacterium]
MKKFVFLLVFLGPNLVQAQPCIEFFQDENFGGTRWSWFCGEPEPPFSAWNDEITSIKVPPGYRVSTFNNSQFGGTRKDFVGNVPNVGSDFNDVISSWKLEVFDSSRCVIGYAGEGYQGEAFAFCPPDSGLTAPPFSRWNDNMRSIVVPPNYRVKLCVDVAPGPVGRGLCRTYFRSVPVIGPQFSYIETGPFEPDNFTMVIMSDPQYHYCDSPACRSIPSAAPPSNTNNDISRTLQANLWHAETIKKIRDQAGNSRFAGVIVNGDLTHGSPGGQIRETQLNDYYTDYENRFQFNTWSGLGNHDYDNHVGLGGGDHACNRGLDIEAIGDCTIWMMRDLVGRIVTMDTTDTDYTISIEALGFEQYYRGSFAYSWEVGNYHFVQLHNHPAYVRNQSAYLSAEILRVFIEVRKSLAWLDNNLSVAASKDAIINMHVMYTDNAQRGRFNATVTPDDWTEFRKILGRHNNVRAIFAGHIHEWAGQDKSFISGFGPGEGITSLIEDPNNPGQFIPGRVVPIFYGGSAQYSKLLWVRFRPEEMTVWTIDTRGGNAPCVEANGQFTCPGIVDTKTIEWAPPAPVEPVELVVERVSTDLAGTGTGTVSVTPDPVSSIGGNFYTPGTVVELTAVPTDRSEFVNWLGTSGSCNSNPVCTITLDEKKNVRAIFAPRPVLTLDTQGPGSVDPSPAGDSCGGGCSLYAQGDAVGLLPTPQARAAFDRWEGDPDCGDNSVTMNGDRTCTAVFAISNYLLNVTADGGSVESNETPGIIDCGMDCEELYSAAGGAQSLVLTATADPGFQFVRWYGDTDCSDEDENDGLPERISITVGTSDVTCSARFVEIGTEFDLTVDKLGVPARVMGTAQPASSSDGLDCALPSCSQSYPVGTQVQLEAIPLRGSIFEGWDGDPDCVDGMVTLTDNVQCSARFTAKVLLVDGSDNDTLRSQYVSVFNSLPDIDYDEWSVRSPSSTSNPDGRAEPNADDLAAYSRVIWYTADAFADGEVSLSAGPSSDAEDALAGFLDGGGCLLISSPQYLTDRGVTQFAETYLGLSEVVSNGGQTQITGGGPLPGFNTLGPLSLNHDDEGLNAALTESAVRRYVEAGNEVMLEYTGGGVAAVLRDNGIHRTGYMTFPFLALPAGTSRIDVMGAFMDFCLQVERDDVFEENDDFNAATPLEGEVALTELRILPGNSDVFRWIPDWSADARITVSFPRESGDLTLEVFDQSQQPVGSVQGSLDLEELLLADVAPGRLHYIRVSGVGAASNRYALAIAPAGPMPGDRDGDDVADSEDLFEDDPLERSDNDLDGIGDNGDTDDDNDGMSDSYEMLHNLDQFDPGDAIEDPDMDGFTNAEEAEWNSDPRDENSTPPTFTEAAFVCDGTGPCTTITDLLFASGFEPEDP